MNHSLDWHQYMLKLKLGCYSISYQFLLIIWIFLIVWLVNLFKMANHWNDFEGYCISPTLSWISCILWAFLQIFEISHTCISKSISQLYYQKRKCTYKYKYIHLLPQMAGFECGKTLLSNDAHIIFYKKGNVHTCTNTSPPATYGNGSVCGKIYFANSVGRWTCVILPKRQAPHSPVITCTNTCSTFQKW